MGIKKVAGRIVGFTVLTFLRATYDNNANNGDIVVALVNEEETAVKRFLKNRGHIQLQPDNDAMEPIYVDKVSIADKVIGLIRTM